MTTIVDAETTPQTSTSATEDTTSGEQGPALQLDQRQVHSTDTSRLATVCSSDGLSVTTDSGVLGPDEFTPFPVPGERVMLHHDGTVHSGLFVALVAVDPTGTQCGQTTQIHLLTPDGLRTTPAMPVTTVDARTCLRAAQPGDEAARPAISALAERITSFERTSLTRQRWLDTLVEDAHEMANKHDWCSDFDTFCADHDLPGRTHLYEVEVAVTLTQRQRFRVEAASEDDAEDQVDGGFVWGALRLNESEVFADSDIAIDHISISRG